MSGKLSRASLNGFLNYGLVAAAFLIVQAMRAGGHVSNSLNGQLVPICAYICMAVSLNLTVGVLGELGRLERESAGEVTQKALEAAAHVTHPTMTELLKKLEKKGFVSSKKEGKMNLYTPLVTQEEYQQQESRSVLEKLYGNSLKRFVNALYQGEKMKKEDIQELSDFLKEMEEDQEE